MNKNSILVSEKEMGDKIKYIKKLRDGINNTNTELSYTFELIKSDYKDRITKAFKGLYEYDRMMLGDILAISKMHDMYSEETEENLYVIMAPSKEAVYLSEDAKMVCVNQEKIIFMSIGYLMDLILNCEFKFIRLALGSEIQVFNSYLSILGRLIKETSDEVNSKYIVKRILDKAISEANSVLMKEKLGTKTSDTERLSAYSAIRLAETYIEDKVLLFFKEGTKSDVEAFNESNWEELLISGIARLKKLNNDKENIKKDKFKVVKRTIRSNILEGLITEIVTKNSGV